MSNTRLVQTSFEKLEKFCREEDYKGWDPFDGLRSRLFNGLPLLRKSRFARLAFLQLMKRGFINLRRPLIVEKGSNPKGLALFLSGYCNLYRKTADDKQKDRIIYLADRLISLRSEGYSGSCWGYDFDWQARAFFQPGSTPNVVVTTYAACALMDAFEVTGDGDYLCVALDARHFVLKDLNRTEDADGDFAFSYSPQDRTQIFNASLLASRLLSRIYTYERTEELIAAAKRSVSFCCKHQRKNGSWSYGTLPFHNWIDSFHSGYNLECIQAYADSANDKAFSEQVRKGFEHYIGTFFTEEGIPKYYDDSMYPIDPHNTAQLIITVSRLGYLKEHTPVLDRVLSWTIKNMQDESGYFFYQKNRFLTNRISYMRWTQAWMFYGLTEYLANVESPREARGAGARSEKH